LNKDFSYYNFSKGIVFARSGKDALLKKCMRAAASFALSTYWLLYFCCTIVTYQTHLWTDRLRPFSLCTTNEGKSS